ncbi:hypothetical protein BX286_4200 [Streptomyces sp. 3211.6]|uniref:DUF3592 domain-containing protein n=1 Tax=Streptomyces TaxID=1883 RepID=UPI0009A53705|nr:MULTISPECIES: hypothetical protein [Streptomyces]RKT06162.1 hypothetical protein BX286_4200 [Streptomyces sp. 3211.6]RPF46299.1 hypothetical protein EDD96_2870 [Streptomyces sp. Ag109_G2-6]
MKRTYEHARTGWTTTTGWLMLASALGAVVCSLAGVSPYPPLTVEIALAGASTAFAVCWAVASYLAGRRPPKVSLTKAPPTPAPRRQGRVLRYLLSFGVPFATAAALVVAATGSSEDGKRTERLERAGYDLHRAEIVRLTGEPDHTAATDDRDGYYETDVVLRVPYDDGPREVPVKAVYTKDAPAPGSAVDVYFAPAHPEVGVGTRSVFRRSAPLLTVGLCALLGPWLIIAGASVKSELSRAALRRLRRFEPATHLPALAILLLGVLALLPVALETEVAGFSRLWTVLAVPAPVLALLWVARRA